MIVGLLSSSLSSTSPLITFLSLCICLNHLLNLQSLFEKLFLKFTHQIFLLKNFFPFEIRYLLYLLFIIPNLLEELQTLLRAILPYFNVSILFINGKQNLAELIHSRPFLLLLLLLCLFLSILILVIPILLSLTSSQKLLTNLSDPPLLLEFSQVLFYP